MKFPNPKKKMAAGYVYSEGGPQHTVDQHVCWWLYEGADVSGFKLKDFMIHTTFLNNPENSLTEIFYFISSNLRLYRDCFTAQYSSLPQK